jgi:CBS domain-containing protein
MSRPSLPRYLEELRSEPAVSFLSNLVESSTDSSLSKIVGLFRERGIYEVFLPDGKRCGMISARDVLKTANFESTKPKAVMSYVPAVGKDSSVGEVARLMTDHRIAAVPISDGRKIIGQVNSMNILAALRGKIAGSLRVTSIATMGPITIDAEAPSAKAKDLMIRKRIDHLPVTKEGHLEGMITSGDIVGHMATRERLGSKSMKPEGRGVFDFPVHEAMQNNPLTCSPDTTIGQALDSMLTNTRTCVLVTQWEELQGIVTSRDFVTLLAEHEPEEDVPVFIVGLPEDPFEAEVTKTKFKRIASQLRRVFPDIIEARSIIKSRFSRPEKERGRYEVSVQIRTSSESYTYAEEGWDLAQVYDAITDRLKRLMTQKQKPQRIRQSETEETP